MKILVVELRMINLEVAPNIFCLLGNAALCMKSRSRKEPVRLRLGP